jgi:tetratricopeptide (TPR) repeat protein
VDASGSKKLRNLICLALAFVTVGIYWQVHGFEFVNFDDANYVTKNPMVRGGLALRNIAWAFTHFYASNWHPLTWISHMLDCQFFGLKPAGPHLVNVFLHAANAVLLFLLLHRLTGAQWRSAIVAGLFAWHPLHVESVAWISERKDVLSTFFGLLSLLAYARYANESWVQNHKAHTWYFSALVCFALSLMAKPMLVTLPFLMLLLDFWPLQRLNNIGWRLFAAPSFSRLAREKWPWFSLAAISCVLTLFAQRRATASAAHFPFLWRVFNAVESYFWYLQKAFWPTKLAAFYPLEHVRPLPPFICEAALFIFITVAAVMTIKRWPFLLVGWLWFVGTLVPVIGLVQVGSQGTADRYSYFPMIGLFIGIVWWAYEFLRGSTARIVAGAVASAIILSACATATVFQVRYWENSVTLFSHALDVTHDNDTALVNLGAAFYDLGRISDALKMYDTALMINPNAPDIHENIGLALSKAGRLDEALAQYEEAERLDPNSAELQSFLAVALVTRGKSADALAHYEEAARLDPENALYQNDLGAALAGAGKRADALPHYARAVWLEGSNARYQNNFATALARNGDLDAALPHYRAAVHADPNFAEAYSNLGALLNARHEFAEAAAQYSQAIRLQPTNSAIRFNAGLAFLKTGREDEALNQFAEASRLRPDWAEPLNAQAWTLATSSNDKVRNGAGAVALAEKAANLTSHQRPVILNTLAAAYAETGRFDDAVTTVNEAIELANRSGQTNLIPKIEHTLALYKAHTPLRE